jgi:hypothetical protein
MPWRSRSLLRRFGHDGFRKDHHQTDKANAAKNLGTVCGIAFTILKKDPRVKGRLPAQRCRALMNLTCSEPRPRLISLS